MAAMSFSMVTAHLNKPKPRDPLMGPNAVCELPETPGQKTRAQTISKEGEAGVSQTYLRLFQWMIFAGSEWTSQEIVRVKTPVASP